MIRTLFILLCFSSVVINLRSFSSLQNHFGVFKGVTIGGVYADSIVVNSLREFTIMFGYKWIRGYIVPPPKPRQFDFDRDFDVDLHDYKVFLGQWYTGVS